jgi:cell division protein FtsW (lipid II flippase)
MHRQSAYILFLAVAVLVSIGIVMLFSTGAFAADSHGDQFRFSASFIRSDYASTDRRAGFRSAP